MTRTEPYRFTRAEADQLAAEFRSGARPSPVAEDYEHGGWTFEYDRGEDGTSYETDFDLIYRRSSEPRPGRAARFSSRGDPVHSPQGTWDRRS